MMLSKEKLGSLLDEDLMEDCGRRREKQKQRSWGRKESEVQGAAGRCHARTGKRSGLEGGGGCCLPLNLTSGVINC